MRVSVYLHKEESVCQSADLSVSFNPPLHHPPPPSNSLSSRYCVLKRKNVRWRRRRARAWTKKNKWKSTDGRNGEKNARRGKSALCTPLLTTLKSNLLHFCATKLSCAVYSSAHHHSPWTPQFIFNPLKAFRWCAPFVYIRAPIDFFVLFLSQTLWQWDKVMTLSCM